MDNKQNLEFKKDRTLHDWKAFLVFAVLLLIFFTVGIFRVGLDGDAEIITCYEINHTIFNGGMLLGANVVFLLGNVVCPKGLFYPSIVIGLAVPIWFYIELPYFSVAYILTMFVIVLIAVFVAVRKHISVSSQLLKTSSRALGGYLPVVFAFYLLCLGITCSLAYFIMFSVREDLYIPVYFAYLIALLWMCLFFDYLFQVFASSIVIGK